MDDFIIFDFIPKINKGEELPQLGLPVSGRKIATLNGKAKKWILGRRKAEVGRRKAEVGRRKSEGGSRKLPPAGRKPPIHQEFLCALNISRLLRLWEKCKVIGLLDGAEGGSRLPGGEAEATNPSGISLRLKYLAPPAPLGEM